MASRSSGVSSVKKAASTADAPIWKSYLAIRSPNVSEAGNTVSRTVNEYSSGNVRGRKRAKQSTYRAGGSGSGNAIWMMLASPLVSTRSGGKDDRAAALKSIRNYWEQLSVSERQQVLFLDEAELVKQLYKLNLSLLCVGLMQRHLKNSNRTATDGSTTSAKAAEATIESTAATEPTTREQAGATTTTTTPATRSATDNSLEKTYELLEAMEFMDLGTGILTVKTELTEDTDRLFTLVGDVLVGFLSSVHVLTENNFNKLFVTESETINTWANYQRLIAMLVEQLILRSYVNHLEKEAAQQMEQLLLEVSLEDTRTSTVFSTSVTQAKKKKTKKKKKKKLSADAVTNTEQNDKSERADGETFQLQTDEIAEEEPVPEPISELISVTVDSDCQRTSSTGSVDTIMLDADEVEVENSSKKSSGLNPHALAFQPQEHIPTASSFNNRSSLVGKRKFDECIVSVPWEDVRSEDGSSFDCQSFNGDVSDAEDEIDDKGDNRRWRKQRRREEDAALEWQLQQVYASTSSLFGWDFSRQCELPKPQANFPWNESTLWRTAPKEVVRYFSSSDGDSFSRFHAPHFLPSSSRYYFNPGQGMPFGPPLLPPPGMESMPPHHVHNDFTFPMVVSSPDFSSPQCHPSHDEEQVDT